MDKLMQKSMEMHKIVRYKETFIKVMTTYKSLLEAETEQLHKHNVMPSLPRFADLIYEEDLPDIMTKQQYSDWYDKSCLVDGVRMGPPFTPSSGNGA